LEIDLFQLQNIVQNQVPYLLFGVGPKNPMGIVKTGLLNRLEHYEGPDLAAELESRNVEKDFPIIVVCENGETSLDVARKVEQRGFRNVYVLNGGWSRLA
jgi:rhodanese-related sulfurtransferase